MAQLSLFFFRSSHRVIRGRSGIIFGESTEIPDIQGDSAPSSARETRGDERRGEEKKRKRMRCLTGPWPFLPCNQSMAYNALTFPRIPNIPHASGEAVRRQGPCGVWHMANDQGNGRWGCAGRRVLTACHVHVHVRADVLVRVSSMDGRLQCEVFMLSSRGYRMLGDVGIWGFGDLPFLGRLRTSAPPQTEKASFAALHRKVSSQPQLKPADA